MNSNNNEERSIENEFGRSVLSDFVRIGLVYFLFSLGTYLFLYWRSVVNSGFTELILAIIFSLSVACSIAIYSILFNVTLIQFGKEGITLKSVGRRRFGFGRENYISYSQLRVQELPVWSWGLSRALKFMRGKRRIHGLFETAWGKEYEEIKMELRKRLAPSEFIVMSKQEKH